MSSASSPCRRRQRICVFCGSSDRVDAAYLQVAERLGEALACAGLALVYGGARVGMMGRLADSVLRTGGHVTGVIPASINDRVGHPALSEIVVVDSMHERKSKMYELADGFIALPGGLGTMEELFEILTWQQLGYHGKPCGLVNARDFFNALLQFIDHTVGEGFLKPAHRELILVESEPARLIERLRTCEQIVVDKWAERD